MSEDDPLARLRQEYAREGTPLERADPDPLQQLRRWLDDAIAAGVPEPNAMTLATADARGRPSARTVLLKGLDERGLAWFTNLRSRKSVELADNPRACAVLYWATLARQATAEGPVEPVDDAEADAYFASRPRDSQLAAWASEQSQVLPDRAALEDAVAQARARFGDEPIPRPSHWGGWRLRPDAVELWQGRPSRLHDRLRYRRDHRGWVIERLAP